MEWEGGGIGNCLLPTEKSQSSRNKMKQEKQWKVNEFSSKIKLIKSDNNNDAKVCVSIGMINFVISFIMGWRDLRCGSKYMNEMWFLNKDSNGEV